MDEDYSPPLDMVEVAYNKTPLTVQDAGDPVPSPEPPKDLSDISDDLPAVKAMTKEKLTARSKDGARSQTLPLRSRGSSVGMSSYRSRSPLHDRLGNSSVRSRSRSPAPVRKQKIKQELPKPGLQKTTLHNQKPQNQGRDALPGPIQEEELSAVLGYCLKCFHTNDDPNGKGHPFIFCPRAQLTVRQLAAALEADEVRAPADQRSAGEKSVSFCLSKTHMTKQESFECALSGGPRGRKAKIHNAVEVQSFAADAMAFVRTPCVSCNKTGRKEAARSHCAINCFSPTWDAELWVKTKKKLDEIYDIASHTSTANKHIMNQPSQTAQKLHHHHLPHAQQQRAEEAFVQQSFPPKNATPHVHPSRLSLQQEDSLPANGAPRVHPSRLSLHRHENTAEAPACAVQPSPTSPTWHSALLSNMLQAEMRARPGSWLEVALTVQGNLRQLLMMDIVHGHGQGTPWTIPLLELLDPRVANLEQIGLDSSGVLALPLASSIDWRT